MKKFIFIGLFLFVIIIQGCQKDENLGTNNFESTNQLEQLQTSFAKTFAVALNESSELRTLVKKEALKQFDKDYDVLYYQLKNQKVGDETVSQLLSRLSESETEFKIIEDELPLLNIYVPQLPDFSANSWNVGSDIPKVATESFTGNRIVIHDFEGNVEEVEEGMIPAFPVVVVKTNERLVVEESNLKSGNPFPFRFIDDSFDISIDSEERNISKYDLDKYESKTKNSIATVGYYPAYLLAWQSYWNASYLGGDKLWHRDFAYYGMTKDKQEGDFRTNVSEFINNIRFVSDAGLEKISDQDSDPKLRKKKSRYASDFGRNWTEGHFEFVIDIIINSKNGVGDVLQKRFPVRADKLFDITYEKRGRYYYVNKIEPKMADINLELIPWDLSAYGNAWKFIVSEYDPSEVIERSNTIKSEFSKNFSGSLSGNLLKKIGWKLGASSSNTETKTSTVKITTTKDSDQLGEAILTFDQPSVVGMAGDAMGVRFISTGYMELLIAPRKVY